MAVAIATALVGGRGRSWAAEAQPAQRQLTPEEIDAWLDSRALPKSEGPRDADNDSEAPPPPPRKKGFVLESSLGVLGQVGSLKHIIPSAPWFGLKFGYEPLRPLMVFVEADLSVASTSYGRQPPPPRSFAFYNFGAGLRLTIRPVDRFGIYLQGSLGGGRATDDVLAIYGYTHADQLGFYQSAELGLEWYQVNPHLALVAHGGIRNYPLTLVRERDTGLAMTWLGSAGLRYTF